MVPSTRVLYKDKCHSGRSIKVGELKLQRCALRPMWLTYVGKAELQALANNSQLREEWTSFNPDPTFRSLFLQGRSCDQSLVHEYLLTRERSSASSPSLRNRARVRYPKQPTVKSGKRKCSTPIDSMSVDPELWQCANVLRCVHRKPVRRRTASTRNSCCFVYEQSAT